MSPISGSGPFNLRILHALFLLLLLVGGEESVKDSKTRGGSQATRRDVPGFPNDLAETPPPHDSFIRMKYAFIALSH